ncbi:MAG: hypothetical protein ACREFQ_15370 [Stellaceae bacterium]
MRRVSVSALSPAANGRIEQSLAEAAPAAPRLVAGAAKRAAPGFELHAGERAVVTSAAGGAFFGAGALWRKVALGGLVVLALIGVASLLRGMVGL